MIDRYHALSEVHVPKAAVAPQIRDWSFRCSPRLSQLMSDDFEAMASWGCELTPVGGARLLLPPKLKTEPYALLGARCVPHGLVLVLSVGSQASLTLSGMPLEYPDEALEDGRSILPATPSPKGSLPTWPVTIGLPELTRFIAVRPSKLRGGTVAESCVTRGLWCWCWWWFEAWEYRELCSEVTVVRFPPPKPRICSALPPDQYRFQPELLRVPSSGSGAAPLRGRGAATAGWKGAPWSSWPCNIGWLSSCGIGLLIVLFNGRW